MPILRALLSSLVMLSACATHAAAPTPSEPPPPWTVRFVYLVSSDREVRDDYLQAIERAAIEVQRFYARELGGKTFRLASPVVEIARSDKPAAWFYAHDSGSAKDNWGFDNGLAEARRLLGAGHGQEHAWIIYSDGPGNSGRGGAGVAVLPEDDLLGLVGRHPTQKDPRRWVYGLAHELGHALGLGHPADTAAVPNAIMGAGFYSCFPDACMLTDEDKGILHASDFVRAPDAWRELAAARADGAWVHAGGRFVRWVEEAGAGRSPTVRWTEHDVEGATRFRFDEERADATSYRIVDRTRGMRVTIPRAGGWSRWSSDGGATWFGLYELTPVLVK